MSLKVVLITQGLSRVVMPIYESTHNLVGIVEDAPRNHAVVKNKLIHFVKKTYSLFRKEKSLKLFCKQNKIPFFLFEKGNEEPLQGWLKELEVDIIVVYMMSKLLKPIIFELPRYGTINLHPSYLPEHPGRNPWFWTYVNTDLNPGVTLHYVDKGEDTGDIVFQERYQMTLGMESPEMQDLAISKVGSSLILKALKELSDGNELPRKKQDPNNRHPNAYQIDADHNVIDWENWSTEKVWHLLRGTQLWYKPIDQPKGVYKGQRWKVLHFDRSKNHNYGEIVKSGKNYYLATKEGKIFLKPTFSIIKLLRFLLKNDR